MIYFITLTAFGLLYLMVMGLADLPPLSKHLKKDS